MICRPAQRGYITSERFRRQITEQIGMEGLSCGDQSKGRRVLMRWIDRDADRKFKAVADGREKRIAISIVAAYLPYKQGRPWQRVGEFLFHFHFSFHF